MSKRKMDGTGWVDHNELPKGPNGKTLCRMCGKEILNPKRRSFCDNTCVHQYRLRNHHRYASGQLYKRDRGKCAICGIDTYKVRREFLKEIEICRQCGPEGCREEIEKRYKDAGWAPLYNKRYYQADHIVPVAEGGGPKDWPLDSDYLNNFRTLCTPCHKEETRKLRQRLKEKKNADK